MKNLKKIAALVIVLAMALSTVSFAAFTDVAEDASYNEAVTVMAALDLLKGYEDGTFGPDKTITRAEFAAVVVRMLGMEDAAAGAAAATNFTDVPATHWAAGYVKIANQKGVIAGYGDGTFGPDDEVTYEQAIKMLVCALGYAPMFADVADAYPTAYMAQANTLGMTIGAVGKIGDKATRAIVARLAYNALDDKIMEQTGFGSDKKFEAVNKTVLSEYLKVIKGEATVAPVSFKAEDADKVQVSGLRYRKDPNQEYNGINVTDGKIDAVAGLEIAKGYNNIVFISYIDGEDEAVVKAIVPQTAKAETLVITKEQAEGGIYTADTSFEYYVTSKDVSTKMEKINLASGYEVYENNNTNKATANEITAFFNQLKAGNIPTATFIDKDDDNLYDFVLYTKVTARKVEKINSKKMTVEGYKFDPELEDQTYTLTNGEGKEISFADIKVGDVLNVIESTDGQNKQYQYIVTNNIVEGTVTEIDGTDAYIGGTAYVDDYGVAQGNSGKFYIDILGRIVDFELDSSSNKFATLMHIYKDSNGADETVKALIYTAAGKFETFEFAKNVEVNNKATQSANYTVSEDATTINAVETMSTGVAGVTLPANAPTVIMYAANSSNQINKIYTAANITTATGNTDYTYNAPALNNKVYDAADNTLGNDEIAENAVIITSKYAFASNLTDATGLDPKEENFSIVASSYFADDESYTIESITDKDGVIVYMTVIGATPKVSASNPIMYVTATPYAGQTSDGDPYMVIKGIVDDKVVTIKANEDTYVYDIDAEGAISATDVAGAIAYNDIATKITVGSMIQYNEGDYASAVRLVMDGASVAAMNTKTGGHEIYNPNGDAEDDDKDGYIYVGSVAKLSSQVMFDTTSKKIRDNSELVGVKAVLNTNKDAVDTVYANYTLYDIETTENASLSDANDDIVILYVFDRTITGLVIIDNGNDID